MDVTRTIGSVNDGPGGVARRDGGQGRGHDNSYQRSERRDGLGPHRADGSGDVRLAAVDLAASDRGPPEGPVDLPEPPERLYAIRVKGRPKPKSPGLAAALDEMYAASDRDPGRFHNNPAKKREALEGLGRLLDEWQAENGAFTDEERARARAVLYGP